MYDTEPEDIEEQNDETVFKIPTDMFDKEQLGKFHTNLILDCGPKSQKVRKRDEKKSKKLIGK